MKMGNPSNCGKILLRRSNRWVSR